MPAVIEDPQKPYVFSNDQPTAPDLLRALGETLDPFTRIRLTEAGVTEGMCCLEVGAGAGTIAGWLADRVGPAGVVVATDVAPQHIPLQPGLTVVRHNVVTEPIPYGPYDLIHARAVLQHLPQRQEVLATLVAALRPGGVIVVEELEARWSTAVLATPDPDPGAHDLFARYETAMARVLTAGGNDPSWCRRVHSAMCDLGLADVDTQGWHGSWAGGSGVALLAHAGSTELRDQLVVAGMTIQDLDTLQRLAMHPDLVLRGILLLSSVGRKPA
jgi:SAM-dependent methyltransferase